MRRVLFMISIGFLHCEASVSTASDWVRLGPDMATATALAAHPTEPHVALAGTQFGGVFRTTDGADTWSYVGLRGYSINNIEYAPSDPTVVYLSMGRWFDGEPGEGVFRSIDGGVTWTPARAGLERDNYPPGSPYFSYARVDGLAVDPFDELIAWAATNQEGLFKTTDGGRSWSEVPGFEWGICPTVVASSSPAQEIFVGYFGVRASADGGQSWTDASDGLRYEHRGELRVHVPRIMVEAPWRPGALIAQADSWTPFVFDPDSRTWSRRGWGLPPYGISDKLVTDIAPGPPGSSELWLATGWSGVIRSEDRGQTFAFAGSEGLDCIFGWDESGEPITSYLHTPDLVVLAGEGNRLLASTEQRSLMRSIDGGATWHTASSGMSNVPVSALTVDPESPDTMVVASGGLGLFFTEDGGAQWTEVLSHELHDCSYLSPNPWSQPPPICWAWSEIRRGWSGELLVRGQCGTYLSDDGGSEWQPAETPVRWPLGHTADLDLVFSSFLDQVEVSDDLGATWQTCGDLPPPPYHGASLRSVAVDLSGPKVILALRSTRVYRSDDGCDTWGLLGDAEIDCPYGSNHWVGTDPRRLGRSLLANDCGLWESTDGAVTWTRIALDNMAPRTLLFDPTRPDVVYAATEDDGVMVSINGGSSWWSLGYRLRGRAVTDLELHPDGLSLLAAVSDDGIYRLELLPSHFDPVQVPPPTATE